MVHPGDPLLEIDDRPYMAALTQAEGALAHDQGLLKEAEIDLVRYRRAYAHNAIPKQQLDDQIQIVAQDKGTVQADEGALENAKVNLAYCHISSPIEGRVGLQLVDPGNMVQANSTTALVVVTQLHPMTVVFSISEDHLPAVLAQLHQGQTLQAEAFDRAQEKVLATGSLLSLDNQIDATTGTVRLKAVFKNENDALFPNQFVNIKLKVDTEKNDTLIATQAVQRNAQGPFVYVIGSDQTAKVRQVKTGTSDGNVIAVQEGIKDGEVVATDGFDKLQDGAKISVHKESIHKELAGTKGTTSEAP
jgi:multidrug efflux system membrane fusion protein